VGQLVECQEAMKPLRYRMLSKSRGARSTVKISKGLDYVSIGLIIAELSFADRGLLKAAAYSLTSTRSNKE
jgi:hypothetical protein